MTSKVYMITHRRSYRKYIGITSISVNKRWINHVNAARRGCIQLLHAAIHEHGSEAFIVDSLIEGLSWAEALRLEKLYIQTYNSLRPNGYNMTAGGQGALGRRKTKAQKKKESRYWDSGGREKHSARFKGSNNPMFGKSPGNKGKPGLRGLAHPNFGKRLSNETRIKIAAAKSGKPWSPKLRAARMEKNNV